MLDLEAVSAPRMNNLAGEAKSSHLASRGDVHEGHGRRGTIVTAAAAGQEFDALDTAESAKKEQKKISEIRMAHCFRIFIAWEGE